MVSLDTENTGTKLKGFVHGLKFAVENLNRN